MGEQTKELIKNAGKVLKLARATVASMFLVVASSAGLQNLFIPTAQAAHGGAHPGGVSANLDIWFRADAGTGGGATVPVWQDQSGNSRDATLNKIPTSAAQDLQAPTLVENSFNFNPALEFSSVADTGYQLPAFSAGNDFDYIAVVRPDNSGSSGVFDSYPSRADVFRQEGDKFELWQNNPITELDSIANTAYIWGLDASPAGTNPARSLDLYKNSANVTTQGTLNPAKPQDYTNSVSWGSPDIGTINNVSRYDGEMAEVLIYSTENSFADRQKIFSYLALKYGISLDQTIPADYTDSSGASVWSATTNSGYGSNINGLIQDDGSELDQRVSKSQDLTGVVTIAHGVSDFTSANLAAGRTALGDGNSLIWGSNGLTPGGWTGLSGPVPDGYGRIATGWKVEETGSVGVVNLQVDINDPQHNIPDPVNDLYFVRGADLSTATPIKMTDNGGGLYTVPGGVNFADGDKFTFATLGGATVEFDNKFAASTDESAADNFPKLRVNGTVFGTGKVDITDTATGVISPTTTNVTYPTQTVDILEGVYGGSDLELIAIPLATLVDDDTVEGDDEVILSATPNYFTLSLGDVDGTDGAENIHAYTVTEDDAAIVEFAADSGDDEDTGGNLPALLIDGTIGTGAASTVTLISSASTATLGTDYTMSGGSITPVTIPPGTYTPATPVVLTDLNLVITSDTDPEPDETIGFTLTGGTGNAVIGDADGLAGTDTAFTYTITNDDDLTAIIRQAGSQSDPTNTSPIKFEVEFSGAIDPSTFANTDINVTGATSGLVVFGSLQTTDNITWTFDVVGMTDGQTVSVNMPANSVTASGGLANLAAVPGDNSVTFDNQGPATAVTIDSITDDSGAPSDFITSDNNGLTINATLSAALAVGETLEYSNDNGSTWSDATASVPTLGTAITHVDALLISTNTVKFRVADSIGNSGSEASQLVTIDVAAPLKPAAAPSLVAGSDTGSDPSDSTTNLTTPELEVVCSEVGSTITITSSNPGATNPVGTHDCTVPGIANVALTLPAGTNNLTYTESDAAGNISPSSDPLAVEVDLTKPTATVVVTPGQASPTNDGNISFTVTFDEPVDPASFTTTDITPTGPAGTSVTSVAQTAPNDGTTFTVIVAATGDGTVGIDLPLNAAEDVAGNGSEAATLTGTGVEFDSTGPATTVTIDAIVNDTGTPGDFSTSDNDGLTVDASLSAPLAAGEKLEYSNNNGTTWTDITTSVTGTAVSHVDPTLTASNTIKLRVVDDSDNTGAEAEQAITIDTTGPSTALTITSISEDTGDPTDYITSDANGLTISGTLDAPLTAGEKLQYSEDDGATWVDVPPSAVTGTDVSYTDPTFAATATVRFRAVDDAGNPGPETTKAITIDTDAPTKPATAPNLEPGSDTGSDPTDNMTSDVKPKLMVSCSEADAVITLTSDNPGATNPVGTHTCAGTTPEQITVTNDLPEGQNNLTYTETDVAGNISPFSDPLEVTVDLTKPTATAVVAPGQASPTSDGNISFTVTFDEPVGSGTFSSADVNITGPGGTVTSVTPTAPGASDDGTTFTVIVAATGDGTVGIDLPLNAAEDVAGNGSEAASLTGAGVEFDNSPPSSITVTSPSTGKEVGNPTTVAGTCEADGSIEITTIMPGGISPHPTLGTVDGSGNYSVDVTWVAAANAKTYDLVIDCYDLFGNGPITETIIGLNVDLTPPNATITVPSTQASPTGISPILFTVVFDEPIDEAGLEPSDFVFTGGITSAAVQSITPKGSNTYEIAVNVIGQGDVTATLPAGNVADLSGNGNTEAISTDSVSFDNSPPEPPVIVVGPLTNTNTGNPTSIEGFCEVGATVNITTNPLGGLNPDPTIPITNVAGAFIVGLNWVTGATGSTYDIVVNCTDASGNGPATTVIPNVTVDPGATTPVVDPIAEGDGSITGVADPGATIAIADITCANAPVVADASGAWSCESPSPAPKTGDIVSVSATDTNGDTSDPATVTVTAEVDTTPPTPPTIDPVVDADSNISGSAEPGAAVTVTNDGVAVVCANTPILADVSGVWVCDTPMLAPAVGNTITAIATDPSGNTSDEASSTVAEKGGKAAPSVQPTDGARVTGTADPFSKITVKDADGNTLCITFTNPAGDFICEPLEPRPAVGETVSITQADPVSGEESNAAYVTVIDTNVTGPLPPLLNNPNDGTQVSGRGEPGATVEIRDGSGQVVCTTTVASTGAFTCELAVGQQEGSVLSVILTDEKGNASDPSYTKVDTTDSDGDGIPNENENSGANNGDGNGDGIPDYRQTHVGSQISPVSNTPITMEVSGENCRFINGYDVVSESVNAAADQDFDYLLGLFDYELVCTGAGHTTEVTFYFDTAFDTSNWTWRKFDRNTNTYLAVSDFVTLGEATVGSLQVTTATLGVRDGGAIDEDGNVNARILDPSGPAVPIGVEELSETGSQTITMLTGGVSIVLVAGFTALLSTRTRNNRRA